MCWVYFDMSLVLPCHCLDCIFIIKWLSVWYLSIVQSFMRGSGAVAVSVLYTDSRLLMSHTRIHKLVLWSWMSVQSVLAVFTLTQNIKLSGKHILCLSFFFTLQNKCTTVHQIRPLWERDCDCCLQLGYVIHPSLSCLKGQCVKVNVRGVTWCKVIWLVNEMSLALQSTSYRKGSKTLTTHYFDKSLYGRINKNRYLLEM